MIPYRFTPSYASLRLRRRAERDWRSAKARLRRDIRERLAPTPPPPLLGWLEVESFGNDDRPFAFTLPVRSIECVKGGIRATGHAEPGMLVGSFGGLFRYTLKGVDGSVIRACPALFPLAPAVNLTPADSLSLTANIEELDRLDRLAPQQKAGAQ